jgi:phosphoesterase RecJ-like protein
MLEKLSSLIKNSSKFVITSHVNPDGDSIGCQIALFRYLKKLKKEAKIISSSPTPDNYKFLDTDNFIEIYDEKLHDEYITSANVIFILDTNEYARLRTMENVVRQSKAKKVCIDHHLGNNKNGFDLYYSDTDSPATGEILYNFFSQNGYTIDYDIAVPLYTAIMTDTGSFRFERTDSETHRITANLLETGVNPEDVYSCVYNYSTHGRLKLLSLFLSHVKLELDDKIAYGILKKEYFEQTGTNIMDTDGFSAHLLSISTVKLGIIFTESERGVKVSFRSKGDIYVNELAKHFGGGGHKNAAGAFILGAELDELVQEVIDKTKKFLR